MSLRLLFNMKSYEVINQMKHSKIIVEKWSFHLDTYQSNKRFADHVLVIGKKCILNKNAALHKRTNNRKRIQLNNNRWNAFNERNKSDEEHRKKKNSKNI